MIMAYPKFDEKKTTQIAGLFTKWNGGTINYMKLTKLIYNADREALLRFNLPLSYDDHYSLPHGLIVSKTLDLAEKTADAGTYWRNYFETDGMNVHLISETDIGELSRKEINLLEELYEKYKDKDQFDMEKEHHNPDLFPEYKDPGNSRIRSDIYDLMETIGKTKKEIKEFSRDVEETAYFNAVFN